MHLLRRAGFWSPHVEVAPPGQLMDGFGLRDAATISMVRGRKVEDRLRLGPNEVHAAIIHADGSVTDLGISKNLLTNSGRDLVAAAMGAGGFGTSTEVATGATATSLTDTGSAFTTDQYKGWTVYAEETTNTPVLGNIGSNTATVLTIDQWWNADGTTGTTPGATANYSIIPTLRPRFIGLTENAGAPAAGDTALTGEITTGGASRALGTYAHTAGTNTFTLTKSFSITGTFPAIHKAGAFTCSTLTATGIMAFESALNADANVVSGDTLQITWTFTLS